MVDPEDRIVEDLDEADLIDESAIQEAPDEVEAEPAEDEQPQARRRRRAKTLNELPRDEVEEKLAELEDGGGSGEDAGDQDETLPAQRDSITMGRVQVIGSDLNDGTEDITTPGEQPGDGGARPHVRTVGMPAFQEPDEPIEEVELVDEIPEQELEEQSVQPVEVDEVTQGEQEVGVSETDGTADESEEILELSEEHETEAPQEADAADPARESAEEIDVADLQEEPAQESEDGEEPDAMEEAEDEEPTEMVDVADLQARAREESEASEQGDSGDGATDDAPAEEIDPSDLQEELVEEGGAEGQTEASDSSDAASQGEPTEQVQARESEEEIDASDLQDAEDEAEEVEELDADQVQEQGAEPSVTSRPPPPPSSGEHSKVEVEDDSPPMVAIPEEDVRRDYKVAVERQALETAAEVIPPEFLVEEGATPPKPPRPKRKRRPRRWYEEIFNDDYLLAQPELSSFQLRREIDFIENGLGLRPGAMLLDLACGPGTHAIEMAKRGYQVVGLDLSVAMLAIAGEEAQTQEQKINFLHGDMRDLQFGPTFDGVYCIGSSYGYFDEENNHKVLQGVHNALKPGGVFMLEVDNRDYLLREQPNLLWFEGDGFTAMEETSFDFISSRFNVKRTLLFNDGGKNLMEYSIRVYSLHELGNMLHNIGFAVVSVGGHRAAPRTFMGEEAPKIIISAVKRAEENKK